MPKEKFDFMEKEAIELSQKKISAALDTAVKKFLSESSPERTQLHMEIVSIQEAFCVDHKEMIPVLISAIRKNGFIDDEWVVIILRGLGYFWLEEHQLCKHCNGTGLVPARWVGKKECEACAGKGVAPFEEPGTQLPSPENFYKA